MKIWTKGQDEEVAGPREAIEKIFIAKATEHSDARLFKPGQKMLRGQGRSAQNFQRKGEIMNGVVWSISTLHPSQLNAP